MRTTPKKHQRFDFKFEKADLENGKELFEHSMAKEENQDPELNDKHESWEDYLKDRIVEFAEANGVVGGFFATFNYSMQLGDTIKERNKDII